MSFGNTSLRTNGEFWFIPLDILMVMSSGFVAVVASIFLLILVWDRACRNISTMHLCNSFLAEFLFACVMLSMALFTLRNDLKEIRYADSLCALRGYLSYATSATRSHSYLLQSIYRYIKVVYPSQTFSQSMRFQLFCIALTWIISMLHPLPFTHLTNQIEYNADNQVCHMPLQNYRWIFYTCFLAYLSPILLIVVIYFKLVRYVQGMSRVITPVNQLFRAQRELQMVRRIVFLVIFLVTLGLPYTIFFLLSFFRHPPKYHFRIAFLFVDLSLVFVIIALFQFTDPIRTFVTTKINQWTTKSNQSSTELMSIRE